MRVGDRWDEQMHTAAFQLCDQYSRQGHSKTGNWSRARSLAMGSSTGTFLSGGRLVHLCVNHVKLRLVKHVEDLVKELHVVGALCARVGVQNGRVRQGRVRHGRVRHER